MSNPTIKIFGEIGDPEEGTTAKMFDEAISRLNGEPEIDVLINSQGGLVLQGTAIADAIQNFAGKVNTIIVGGAFSIAGYIACSGTGRRIIRKKGMLHIHGPQLTTQGNLQDHEDSIEELQHTTKQMGDHYAEITGRSYDEIVADFHRDRFYDADQAVELGFMTEVDDAQSAVVAMKNYETIRGLPRKFAAAWSQASPTNLKEDDSMANKATIKELKQTFRGASAEFLVSQLDAEATIESATAAYISNLESEVGTLKTSNANLKTKMEAMEGDGMEAMTDEETIAMLRAEIKAMKEAKAMDDDYDDDDMDLEAMADEMEAMDDEEMTAMDDDDMTAMSDDDMKAMDDEGATAMEEVEALRAQVKALRKVARKAKAKAGKAKAKAGKTSGRRRRTGARAIQTSTSTPKQARRESATAEVNRRASKMREANASLSKSESIRQVYREDPALRQRMVSESNG